jgi:hypothetical protein
VREAVTVVQGDRGDAGRRGRECGDWVCDVERVLLGPGGMRGSTVVLGLAVTAGAVVTVGSGWRVARPVYPCETAGTKSAAQARMSASEAAGYPASQGAGRDGATGRSGGAAGRVSDGGAVSERSTEAKGAAALPWLHNFAATAESSVSSAAVVERMTQWRTPDASCSATAYGGLTIMADVAAGRGAEEVLASFTQGVLVLDASGKLLASATAPKCQGSADEIEAIAAGDAHIDGPVIALAVTTGGHRESSTWLVLYRVIGGVVEPVFSGAVEERVGEQARAGAVTLLPGALL